MIIDNHIIKPAFKTEIESVWGWRGNDLYRWYFMANPKIKFRELEMFDELTTIMNDQIEEENTWKFFHWRMTMFNVTIDIRTNTGMGIVWTINTINYFRVMPQRGVRRILKDAVEEAVK